MLSILPQPGNFFGFIPMHVHCAHWEGLLQVEIRRGLAKDILHSLLEQSEEAGSYDFAFVGDPLTSLGCFLAFAVCVHIKD